MKAIYAEFTIFATRKYHINIREAVEMVTKYLATVALYDFNYDSEVYKSRIAKLNLPVEIEKFLLIISYLHFAACSECDYFSSKTHPKSITRLQLLAKAHYLFKELCPEMSVKFEQNIKAILKKDSKTEFTTLENLYFSEFNKIRSE